MHLSRFEKGEIASRPEWPVVLNGTVELDQRLGDV